MMLRYAFYLISQYLVPIVVLVQSLRRNKRRRTMGRRILYSPTVRT